jgi:hypothetical protein
VSTSISETGGRIEITMDGGGAARLFGLPFLAAGAYFAYNLILGMIELVTGRAALSEMAVGTVLVIIMTAAFLVPGWLLVFSRGKVAIDRTARTVESIRDLRVYQLRERRSMDEFDAIAVDRSRSSGSRGSARVFKVELLSATRKKVLIGVFDEGDDALSFARRLSTATGLPVDDARERELSDEEV